MPPTINELDIVALLHDLSEEGLHAGDTGTVVYVHDGGEAFEVEFPGAHYPPRFVVVTVDRALLLKLNYLDLRPNLPAQ